VILAVLYALIVSTISRSMEHNIGKLAQSFGLPQDRYEELAQRMEEGDETATLEMMKEVNAIADRYEDMTEKEKELFADERAEEIAKNLAPYFTFFGILTLLLFLCGTIISLVAYVEDHGHFLDVINRCGSLLFPMASVLFRMFIKSFVWVVFLSLVPGLNLLLPFFVTLGGIAVFLTGPSLLLAPVLLVESGLSPKKAVEESLRRSKGYWGHIVGNVIVVGILIVGVNILLGKILYGVAQRSDGAAVFLGGVVQQLTLFFFVAFLIQLLRSLPQKTIAK